jgi:uncharacterized coiled-coil protein SlyX
VRKELYDMSNPRPESRIKSLEKRATTIEAAIEELADDTAEELKAIRQDIKRLDSEMKSSFIDIGKAFDLNANNIEAVRQGVEKRLDQFETRFDKIESVQTEQGKKLDLLLELVQKRLGE